MASMVRVSTAADASSQYDKWLHDFDEFNNPDWYRFSTANDYHSQTANDSFPV